MKKIASIDLGSNSAKLLIAEITDNNGIVPIYQQKATPRLADGLKKTGMISKESLKRAVESLEEFKQKSEDLGVNEIHAIATQALREANNSREVIDHILEMTGINIKVISGKREAELTYQGAVTGIDNLRKGRILFDVGGASTEFVLAENDNILNSDSLPIGAVAITEENKTDGITSPSRLSKIKADIVEYLIPKLSRFSQDEFDLISSGGTVSAYKRYEMGPPFDDPDRPHGTRLKLDSLESMIAEFAALKLSEREGVIIFEPERANVIVAGGLILAAVCDIFRKLDIIVSTRSLRWGFLISLM